MRLTAGLVCATSVVACIWAIAGAEPFRATLAASPSTSPARYSSVRIDGVPHIRQRPDFCGEACAEMMLRKLRYRISQDDVFNMSGVDPSLGRGCYTRELYNALTRVGFRVGTVWFAVAATGEKATPATDAAIEAQFKAMHADLAAGIPSIVCMHYDDKPETTEHFRLVVGYDADKDEVIYHEPAEANGGYRRMSRKKFKELWPLKYEKEEWTLVRFQLRPGQIRVARSGAKFTPADYAQHCLRLRRTMPEGFSIVIQGTFVVVGDEEIGVVRGRARDTVQWAVDRLKASYFPDDPETLLDVWLFKDKESYMKNVKKVFKETPHTPFGYYSSRHRALIMNIDTGGGTLVHEIVHPFMAANFPECPSWFNEGLASLYEQSGEYRGRIWGFTNWRLKGLQNVIKGIDEDDLKDDDATNGDADSDDSDDEKKEEEEKEKPELPSFKQLCSTTTRQFYYQDPGTNYSQARYLCYYLQQRGLLEVYYRQFRQNVRRDPSGYETLKSVLGLENEEQMKAFQERWEAWVLELRYP